MKDKVVIVVDWNGVVAVDNPKFGWVFEWMLVETEQEQNTTESLKWWEKNSYILREPF